MAKDLIQVTRGLKADLPQLMPGEIGFCTDTEEAFIGNGDGNANIPFGAKGEKGEKGTDGKDGSNGATFTPAVSSKGVLSWTNDGGLANPAAVNIKGEKGDKGDAGTSEATAAAIAARIAFAVKMSTRTVENLTDYLPDYTDLHNFSETWDGVTMTNAPDAFYLKVKENCGSERGWFNSGDGMAFYDLLDKATTFSAGDELIMVKGGLDANNSYYKWYVIPRGFYGE